MDHIFDMLNHLKRIKGKIQCIQEVSLAIFFHELVPFPLLNCCLWYFYSIVYDPKAHDNEDKSADDFMVFTKECLDENAVRMNHKSSCEVGL